MRDVLFMIRAFVAQQAAQRRAEFLETPATQRHSSYSSCLRHHDTAAFCGQLGGESSQDSPAAVWGRLSKPQMFPRTSVLRREVTGVVNTLPAEEHVEAVAFFRLGVVMPKSTLKELCSDDTQRCAP